MYVLNITGANDSFINFTDYENDDTNIFLKYYLFQIPGSVLLLFLFGLRIWKTLTPLLTNNDMDKFLYPQYPVRCIITGSSECGKTYFLTVSHFKYF